MTLCRHNCRKRCRKCVRTNQTAWAERVHPLQAAPLGRPLTKKDKHRARFRAEPVVCVWGKP